VPAAEGRDFSVCFAILLSIGYALRRGRRGKGTVFLPVCQAMALGLNPRAVSIQLFRSLAALVALHAGDFALVLLDRVRLGRVALLILVVGSDGAAGLGSWFAWNARL
jgi:hypothetical protein